MKTDAVDVGTQTPPRQSALTTPAQIVDAYETSHHEDVYTRQRTRVCEDLLARERVGSVATPFTRVFVSYAHEDAVIVERLERMYEPVRIEYLRDVSVLRAGDRWSARILEQIDGADRFRLCWSAAASESRYVEQEWRYALAIRGIKEDTFICPFYWQKPMPPAPPELADLHFAYWELES